MAENALRVATFNTDLARKGPGLLLRDVLSENDPQVEAVARVIARANPDILALQDFDYDHDQVALSALRDRIAHHGVHFPYLFSARPNTGMATGLDLDGDGRFGGPRDAQGYGEFAGQGGMAVLSRFPVEQDGLHDFSDILWRDVPDPLLRKADGTALLRPEAERHQRLSTVAHWVVPIRVEDTLLRLLTFHASPPVFDGPEDRNGRRNHDEIVFWLHYLDGRMAGPVEGSFVLAGDANLDPADSEGRKNAIKRLLADPRLQDPMPMRPGRPAQGEGHTGDPRLDTVDWPPPSPGSLRVSYVLPSSDLTVVTSGILADANDPDIQTASRHRLVWVDLLIE